MPALSTALRLFYGCSTKPFLPLWFTCPAITVETVILRALDRVRERALGLLCRSITQIPARQASCGVLDLPPVFLNRRGTDRSIKFLQEFRDGHDHSAMGAKLTPLGEKARRAWYVDARRLCPQTGGPLCLVGTYFETCECTRRECIVRRLLGRIEGAWVTSLPLAYPRFFGFFNSEASTYKYCNLNSSCGGQQQQTTGLGGGNHG